MCRLLSQYSYYCISVNVASLLHHGRLGCRHLLHRHPPAHVGDAGQRRTMTAEQKQSIIRVEAAFQEVAEEFHDFAVAIRYERLMRAVEAAEPLVGWPRRFWEWLWST
jgi:hypothetical protein